MYNHIDQDDFFNSVSRSIDKTFEEIDTNYNREVYDQTMRGLTIGVCLVMGLIVLCIALCCCKRRRNRGRILSPPVTSTVVITQSVPASNNAPYPQQQYITASLPVQAAHPTPYSPAGVTTQYPVSAPYPTGAGAPYPTGAGAPYPTGTGAPYPTAAGAPYPTGGVAPYHNATTHQPSAPDFHTLPPTYEQATAQEYKHT